MARTRSCCGVILAAGESTRMGSDKALLPWPPQGALPQETFLSAAIRSLEPFNDLVLVVVGKNESTLPPVVYACGASLVRIPDPERGQFSFLQTGLRAVMNIATHAAMAELHDR